MKRRTKFIFLFAVGSVSLIVLFIHFSNSRSLQHTSIFPSIWGETERYYLKNDKKDCSGKWLFVNNIRGCVLFLICGRSSKFSAIDYNKRVCYYGFSEIDKIPQVQENSPSISGVFSCDYSSNHPEVYNLKRLKNEVDCLQEMKALTINRTKELDLPTFNIPFILEEKYYKFFPNGNANLALIDISHFLSECEKATEGFPQHFDGP